MLGKLLENVRNASPLIHNITNYVTVNDCANILLACGGSPIMTDDPGEVEDITSICSGLVINIGTLSQQKVPAMLLAGRKSNELGHPVVFDPVGAGGSRQRTESALRLLSEIRFSVIRGNISEIKALAKGSETTSGVDANDNDRVTENNLDNTIQFAKDFAAKTGAVIIITGETDIVAGADNAYIIRNGHPMMSRVTGTGCQLSALTAAFVTANPDNTLDAAAAAVCTLGLAGEIAYNRMSRLDGNASYRNYLIDAVFNMTADELNRGAKYENR